MKITFSKNSVLLLLCIVILGACSGSRKYFKAGEKLETQGLVDEAAEFYLEALQRKNTNTDARIKLKQTGQKYVSYLSSEFFRNYNLNQNEASLTSFEKLTSFTSRAGALGVDLSYPSEYNNDYKTAIDKYCVKNYTIGAGLLKLKKYNEALKYLQNVIKYNPEYKNVAELKTTAVCEPLYQNAISAIENKNYNQASTFLSSIQQNTTNTYKDSKELLDFCLNQQKKGVLIFKSTTSTEKGIADYLFDSFSTSVSKVLTKIYLVGSGPFSSLPQGDIANNVDLIQGIKKATGADFFYTYEVANKQSQLIGPSKNLARCFQRIMYKTNDGRIITDYKPVDYYQTIIKRSYSYQFKYSLINAAANQVVSSQNLTINMQDNVEYNEFAYPAQANINEYYPYNPISTFGSQYNLSAWRGLFTANRNVKSEDELATLANQDAIKKFTQTITNYIQ
jgi:tetratricopeptide (TPR) repeat protein